MQASRRSIMQAFVVAGAAIPLLGPVRALASATPEADEGGLSPELLNERLRAIPVSSPLFPSDTGALTIVDWADTGDDDLVGTIGAMTVQDSAKGEAGTIGAFIVHPSAESAQARMREIAPDQVMLFGNPAVTVQEDGYSLVAVVKGPVILSAIGTTLTPPLDGTGAFDETDARALGNLAGMLDHLRLAMIEPQT
jgi:hypothetical protein